MFLFIFYLVLFPVEQSWCNVPVPLHFASWPDGVSKSGFHFLGYVISVPDTKEFEEVSHFHCLYPPFNPAVTVNVSHAYKNMDLARERISLILEPKEMFLSFQTTFSLVIAAILESTSGYDPSSDIIAPR